MRSDTCHTPGRAGLLPHASLNSEGGPPASADGCLSPGEPAPHANGGDHLGPAQNGHACDHAHGGDHLSPAQNGHACEYDHDHHHLEASSSPRAPPAGGLAGGLHHHHSLANGLANGHMGTPGELRVSGLRS